MCKKFSALYLITKELVFVPESTDSHEDLIDATFNFPSLKSTDNGNGFVRLEYCPQDGNYADIKSYKLHVDQRVRPQWFTDSEEKHVESLLRNRVLQMMIIKSKKVLLGGCYILVGNVNIRNLTNSRIISAGSAIIKDAGFAIIEHAGSATIENAESATIKDAGFATIKYAEFATIKYAGSATIKYAGSATIKHAGSATIEHAESATIKYAESATIKDAGFATIKYAESATIKYARSATIKHARSATIEHAGSATITQ